MALSKIKALVSRLRFRAATQREKPLSKVIRFAVQYADQVSLVLVLVGILGMCLLPKMDRRAKFDEKSLMVGSVFPTFRESGSLQLGLDLAQQLHTLQSNAESSNSSTVDLLQQTMNSLGLRTHVSTATIDIHELEKSHGSEPSTHSTHRHHVCQTVHGVLHAPHADGTEALLLVTPMALTVSGGSQSSYWDAPAEGGLLLAAATASLMAHLSSVTWLSRDVIWVVNDATCGATATLQAWANQYHGINGEGMPGSGAVLKQALVLQADRVDINSAQVLVEGFDGQLPKLDTYMTFKELLYIFRGTVRMLPPTRSTAIDTLANLATKHKAPWSVQIHLSKLSTMMAFAWRQALGLPTGPHAALQPFMVDAASVRFSAHYENGTRLIRHTDPRPSSAGTPAAALPSSLPEMAAYMAEYAELVLRSFNNLDERFHHSFFLYLLTGIDSFVAVEMYIVPLVALIAVLVLKAAKQRDVLANQHYSNQLIWPAGTMIALLWVGACSTVGFMIRHGTCRNSRLCTSNLGSTAGGIENVSQQAQSFVQHTILSHLTTVSPTTLALLAASICTGVCMLGYDMMSLLFGWKHTSGQTVVAKVSALGAGKGCAQVFDAAPTASQRMIISQQKWQAARVALLGWSAVLLTGMASTNWALSYCASLAMAVVLLLTHSTQRRLDAMQANGDQVDKDEAAVSSHQQEARDEQQDVSRSMQDAITPVARDTRSGIFGKAVKFGLLAIRLRVLQLTSPLMAAMLLGTSRLEGALGTFEDSCGSSKLCVWDNGFPAWASCIARALKAHLQMVICCSWTRMYYFLWATYIPVWLFEASRLLRPAARQGS